MDQILDLNTTLSSVIGYKNRDNDIEPFYIEPKMPESIIIEFEFLLEVIKDKSYFKCKYIKNANVFNVRYFVSQLSEVDQDFILLKSNDKLLENTDTLNENMLIIVNDDKLKLVFENSNGLIIQSKTNPKNDYTFKFKVIDRSNNDDILEKIYIDFPKNVNCREVKKKIADLYDILLENTRVYIQNQCISDDTILSSLIISEDCQYFTVTIFDITRARKFH